MTRIDLHQGAIRGWRTTGQDEAVVADCEKRLKTILMALALAAPEMGQVWEEILKFCTEWGDSGKYKCLTEAHDLTIKVTDLEEINTFCLAAKDTKDIANIILDRVAQMSE